MTQETREQIEKRLKSLTWRIGAYVVVASLSAIVDILGIYKVDPNIVAVVALVAGEITKYVNTYKLQ